MSELFNVNQRLSNFIQKQLDAKGETTDENRPIGSKATLNGKDVFWSGQNYGWQSQESFDKLKEGPEFRAGHIALSRLGTDINQAIGMGVDALPEPVKETGLNLFRQGVQAYQRLPQGVRTGVKEVVDFAGDVNETVSKATNVSPIITGEILTTAVTAGAGTAAKAAGKVAHKATVKSLTAALNKIPAPVAYAGKDELLGPVPTRAQLTHGSQIPGFEPKSVKEALFAGSNEYINPRNNDLMGVQEMGGARQAAKPDANPLSWASGKSRAKRRTGRTKIDESSGVDTRTQDALNQTVGENTFETNFRSEGKTFQNHHARGLRQYRPFFKGLDKVDTEELARFADEIAMPLGNRDFNSIKFANEPHNIFHKKWEEWHETILPEDFFVNKSYTLEQRKEALLIYKEHIQQAYDESMYSIINAAQRGASVDELTDIAKQSR
jgi:hypothetical protein